VFPRSRNSGVGVGGGGGAGGGGEGGGGGGGVEDARPSNEPFHRFCKLEDRWR